MSRKDRRVDLGGPGELTHSPFAALRGAGPPSEPPEAVVGEHEPTGAAGDSQSLMGCQVVVRKERKGRGGKTVTVATWQRPLDPGAEALEGLARDLARGLGAGVRVEGSDIVVQGDMVERVAVRLEVDLGARVIRGS